MLSGFNSATLTASSIKGYIMATKAKTRAGRVAERKTIRSQSPDRKKETQAASPSAIDLLEQDHREVEEWFDEYDELKEDDARKAELAQKICLALKVHAQIEEEIFYPQAREATKDNDLIDAWLARPAVRIRPLCTRFPTFATDPRNIAHRSH